jgi:hypothetical protein
MITFVEQTVLIEVQVYDSFPFGGGKKNVKSGETRVVYAAVITRAPSICAMTNIPSLREEGAIIERGRVG